MGRVVELPNVNCIFKIEFQEPLYFPGRKLDFRNFQEVQGVVVSLTWGAAIWENNEEGSSRISTSKLKEFSSTIQGQKQTFLRSTRLIFRKD